jgi:ribulose-phosphate 3-epimerase
MTVNPGFGSQKFLTGMVSKIADLRRRREDRGLSFAIEVDGGINRQTAKQVVAAGADILVSGAAIFDASDRAAQVHALRNVSADADGPRAS